VNAKNVVLFVSPTRGGMARRGAPDKNGSSPEEEIVLRCPSCGSNLRLEPEWTEGHAEVLCGRCETEVPLPDLRQKVVR
jgi:hypothetical protein